MHDRANLAGPDLGRGGRSMGAIAKFAGDEPERAVYYPEDTDFLLELEPMVTHFEAVHRF